MATPSPSPGAKGQHFDTQVSYRLGVPLIYVQGELDHETSKDLRLVIQEEMSGSPQQLVLDVTSVDYMDSAGLSLMFDTLGRFSPPGWLGIVNPNSSVRRLFEMTGLTERQTLIMFADVNAAGRALRGKKTG
jgi:anti-anti-sigma factor